MSTGSANSEECHHSHWHCMHVGGVTGFLKNTADWLPATPPPVKIRFSQTGLRSLLKRAASWAEPSREGGNKNFYSAFRKKTGARTNQTSPKGGKQQTGEMVNGAGGVQWHWGGGWRSAMAAVEYMPRDSVLWKRDPDVDEWGHLEGIRHQLFDIPLDRKQTTAHK